jgi:hypothetical protein
MAGNNSQFYINKSIKYLINKRIYEYDIQSAGLTVLKNKNIITEDTYNLWKTKPKSWVQYYIGSRLGKLQDDIFKTEAEIVSKFIDINEIQDSNIISRKRDAVFIFNTTISTTTIDGYSFKLKNTYTSYFKLENFELYYHSDKDFLDIKGLDISCITHHKLLPYIKKCIMLLERLDQGFMQYREVYGYIHNLRNEYCNFTLPLDCYREINKDNLFTIYDISTKKMVKTEILPDDISRIRIVTNYNFARFIVPFINILSQYRYQAYKTWKR